MITPIVINGLVWWTPVRGASGHVNFKMLGDHGFYCPIAYGGGV